jgi:hypothetical protein
MSCDEAINAAFGEILPLFPNVYTGEELTYLVYNYYVIPEVYASSVSHASRYSIQLHLYLPHKENPNAIKLAIINACIGGGFTYPSMTNASDKDGQHYVFEFEYCNGGGVYAQT